MFLLRQIRLALHLLRLHLLLCPPPLFSSSLFLLFHWIKFDLSETFLHVEFRQRVNSASWTSSRSNNNNNNNDDNNNNVSAVCYPGTDQPTHQSTNWPTIRPTNRPTMEEATNPLQRLAFFFNFCFGLMTHFIGWLDSMKTRHFSMAIWISFYYGNSKKYTLIQKPFERTIQWKKTELSSSFCLAAVYLQIKWCKFSFAKCRQKISTSILIFF